MVRYDKGTCPVCGGVGGQHATSKNACKQRAYRDRLDNEKRQLTAIVVQAIDEDFDESDAMTIYRLLNTIRSKRESHAVDQALRIIINAYRYKMRRINLAGKGILNVESA